MFLRFAEGIKNFLGSPSRVFVICATTVFLIMLFDGSFIQLWSLYNEKKRIETNIKEVTLASKDLELQIQNAKKMDFVERQARDRFDLVEEDDLVFVFSNEQ